MPSKKHLSYFWSHANSEALPYWGEEMGSWTRDVWAVGCVLALPPCARAAAREPGGRVAWGPPVTAETLVAGAGRSCTLRGVAEGVHVPGGSGLRLLPSGRCRRGSQGRSDTERWEQGLRAVPHAAGGASGGGSLSPPAAVWQPSVWVGVLSVGPVRVWGSPFRSASFRTMAVVKIVA